MPDLPPPTQSGERTTSTFWNTLTTAFWLPSYSLILDKVLEKTSERIAADHTQIMNRLDKLEAAQKERFAAQKEVATGLGKSIADLDARFCAWSIPLPGSSPADLATPVATEQASGVYATEMGERNAVKMELRDAYRKTHGWNPEDDELLGLYIKRSREMSRESERRIRELEGALGSSASSGSRGRSKRSRGGRSMML